MPCPMITCWLANINILLLFPLCLQNGKYLNCRLFLLVGYFAQGGNHSVTQNHTSQSCVRAITTVLPIQREGIGSVLFGAYQQKPSLFELDGYWKCSTFDFKSVAQTSVRLSCLASSQMRTAGVENNMNCDYLPQRIVVFNFSLCQFQAVFYVQYSLLQSFDILLFALL